MMASDCCFRQPRFVETGNHIAQLADGGVRRRCAESLEKVLRASCQDDHPWVLNVATWDAALVIAICDGTDNRPGLVEMATQEIGAGDVSILVEAEAYGERVANVAVAVWTLDAQLAAYA